MDQILGAGCHNGEDLGRRYRNGEPTGHGMSYLAFDFTMEIILLRAKFMLEERVLPPALRPLDAEIAFDDILPGGISFIEERMRDTAKPAWQVTVTISCRRPPRFFTEFEDAARLARQNTENRRRVTAMDFALTNLASRLSMYRDYP